MSGNKITGTKVGGSASQTTDSNAGNTIEGGEVGRNVRQQQNSKDGLSIFGYRARGPIAIAAIVVIFIAYYVYQSYAH